MSVVVCGTTLAWLAGILQPTNRLRALAFALLAGIAVPSCQSSADWDSDCAELRDHVIELRLLATAEPGDPRLDRELAKHRRALGASLGDDFIERCARRRDAAHLECAIGAESSAELAACAERASQR